MLIFIEFSGASAGDGVSNAISTGGVMIINVGVGAVFTVMCTGSTITTALCTSVFSSPSSA